MGLHTFNVNASLHKTNLPPMVILTLVMAIECLCVRHYELHVWVWIYFEKLVWLDINTWTRSLWVSKLTHNVDNICHNLTHNKKDLHKNITILSFTCAFVGPKSCHNHSQITWRYAKALCIYLVPNNMNFMVSNDHHVTPSMIITNWSRCPNKMQFFNVKNTYNCLYPNIHHLKITIHRCIQPKVGAYLFS